MKCHYEVLGISRDATNDDIKKAYRKCALQWHPDKNADNLEEANKRFLEIQDAYETLINEQERAWYDSHREVLINGGLNDDETNYTFNIYPYFSSSCFKGYGDDEKGFYGVYRDVFMKIAEEDKPHYDESVEVPDFGDSKSDYDEVVGNFYAFWLSYCTPRSFVWCEQHDTREANDRQIRRAMEKENKKLRDKAKKERNEEVRKLVAFVRKRDKRVEEYKKALEERAKLAQKKSEEKREADRKKRLEQMKNYVEPEWVRATQEQLNELDLSDDAKEKNDNESSDDSDEYDDNFFCVACDKSFKSDKAFINHEKSKKHKENVELVKKHMKEEDLSLFFDSKTNETNETTENQPEDKPRNKMSKKQKKKHKQRAKNAAQNSDSAESDLENVDGSTAINEATNDSSNLTSATADNESQQESEAKKQPEETKPSICSVCKQEFDSRNKLFSHIKEEGHAAIKDTPKAKQTKKTKSKK